MGRVDRARPASPDSSARMAATSFRAPARRSRPLHPDHARPPAVHPDLARPPAGIPHPDRTFRPCREPGKKRTILRAPPSRQQLCNQPNFARRMDPSALRSLHASPSLPARADAAQRRTTQQLLVSRSQMAPANGTLEASIQFERRIAPLLAVGAKFSRCDEPFR